MDQKLNLTTSGDLALKQLAQGTILSLLLQVTGVLLTYLVQVCLARWMGKVEYGIYTYVMAWCLTLAIPASLGLPRAVLRFVSEYRVQEKWGRMRGLLLSSWQFTLVMGIVVAGTSTVCTALVNRYHPFAYGLVLINGVWVIPLLSLLQLQEEMGRGTNNLTLAYGPSKVFWPLLLLGGSFACFQWRGPSLTTIPIIDVTIGSLLIVIGLQLIFIWGHYAKETAASPTSYAHRQWLSVALPLLLHCAFREILKQIDVIMVGSFLGAASAGIYNAAATTALWVSFFLKSTNLVVAPSFTTLYTKKDMAGLQKVVTVASLWILWPSLLAAICLFLFAQPILGLFGPEFITANWSLKILTIGHLTNALCSSVGSLLVMTGYQNQVLMVSSTSAVVNCVLNAIAIPTLGMEGAALATAFTLMLYNIWCTVLVVKNVKIYPSTFASFFHRNALEGHYE